MNVPKTPRSAFVQRRRALLARHAGPVLLAAGLPLSRNFRANRYPFRATSHFLYFVGKPVAGAALLFADGATTLFVDPPDAADALWHGARPSLDEVREAHGVDRVLALDELDAALAEVQGPVATLPPNDAMSAAWLSARLGRVVGVCAGDDLSGVDAALADAMIDLRMRHDDAATDQLRAAAQISAGAHIVGMRATRAASNEAQIAAAMVGELFRHGLAESYGPIVTVHGEVLHSGTHDNDVRPGDLLLADVGGETAEGWAADITRVWPISGVFSATQRAIYDVVLAGQRAAIEIVRPGTRYRDVHLTAARVMVDGLRQLGIFRGDLDGLLERDAASVFFPHGVGHLLGLDVHDLEDLGDRAGYAPGRLRSNRFGECFLRLDRDLEPGMLVTIEPGFYQVPGILGDDAYVGKLGADLDRAALARYADVRGIRIEDDVLVTTGEPDVLTRDVPKDAAAIEALVQGG